MSSWFRKTATSTTNDSKSLIKYAKNPELFKEYAKYSIFELFYHINRMRNEERPLVMTLH